MGRDITIEREAREGDGPPGLACRPTAREEPFGQAEVDDGWLPSTGWREPYDGRLSRTVLREPGGETPPGHSPASEPRRY